MAKKIQSFTAGIATTALPESPALRRARGVEPQAVRTVNGKPIPAAFAHAIPWEHTDQGIAERAARPHAVSAVLTNPVTQRIGEYADQLQAGMEPWEADDPLRVVSEAHRKPGERHRFLSPSRINDKGLRGWEPVIAPNGDPVKVGNMILGRMPEEKANQRNRKYQERGEVALRSVDKDFMEQVERSLRDGKSRPAAEFASGEHDSLPEDASPILR